MGVNLIDLPDRGLPLDTDLIHINTGSTIGDKKITKGNFLREFRVVQYAPSDINNLYNTTGIYFCANNNVSNIPVTQEYAYGYLVCFPSVQLFKEITPKYHLWTRSYYSGTWSSWIKLFDDTYVTTNRITLTAGDNVVINRQSVVYDSSAHMLTGNLVFTANTEVANGSTIFTIPSTVPAAIRTQDALCGNVYRTRQINIASDSRNAIAYNSSIPLGSYVMNLAIQTS